jgi:predicted enzyme related to lactoylglutathione lyase
VVSSSNRLTQKDSMIGMQNGWGWGTGYYPKDMPAKGYTVWSGFDSNTDYFAPSEKEFMFNLVVDDVQEALKQVEEGRAQVIGDIEKLEYGLFGWFIDPDGNKVELWEPSK